MNNKLIIGICMVLLFIAPAYAMTKTYESTSVSRIVGDNPDDLIAQLNRDDLNLRHATSYVNDRWYQLGMEDANKIIREEFPGTYSVSEGDININEVNNNVNNFINSELFVFAPEYNGIMNYEGLTPSQISSWENSFKNNDPLFIFDAKYGGLYLPNKESFVGKLSKYSTIIAPLSYSSKEMVKAIICNLKEDGGIGDSFRQARNNYYWGTEAEEPIGLTMLSYELYGDPTLKVYIPKYQQSVIDKYCENYNKNYTKNSEIARTLLAGSNNNLRVEYEMDIDFFETDKIEGYDIINFADAIQKTDNFELVLPEIIHKTEYPLKTIVTGFGASFEDPVELSLNLAEWQEGFVEKNCYEENKSEYASFAQSFTRDKEIVLAYINPVEIINCESGNVKLYTKVKYWIDYNPYSNILIKSVKADEEVQPNSSVKLKTELENIDTNQENGVLKIKDGESVLKEEAVSLNGGESKSVDVEFSAPEYDGTKILIVVYEDNDGLALTQSDFSLKIERIIDISAPDPDNPGCKPTCVNFDYWVYNKDCAIIDKNIIKNYPFCYPNYCESKKENGEIEKTFCLDYCDGANFYSGGHCYLGECHYENIQESSSCQYCSGFESSKELYLPNGDYACSNGYIPSQYYHGSGNNAYNNVKVSDLICDSGIGKYRNVVFNSRECGYDPCKSVVCNDICDGYTRKENGVCAEGECNYNFIEYMSGKCGYDPCAGVTCQDKCEETTLYSGRCVIGECEYSKKEENSKTCGYSNPCENVKCDDKCEGDTRFENGACAGGNCNYKDIILKSEECGYVDLCKGVKCEEYCDKNDFYSGGVCVNGNCQYKKEESSRACIDRNCVYIGDIDNNGKIAIADGMRILNVLNGKEAFPTTICCYDVNKDGSLSIADFYSILQIINHSRTAEVSNCN